VFAKFQNNRNALGIAFMLPAAVLLVLFRFVLPAVAPNAEFLGMDTPLIAMFGGVLFALVILLWWFFFSRAPWSDRLISLGAIAIAMLVTRPLTDISIQNGFMNRMFYVFAPLTVSLALVIWAVASGAVQPQYLVYAVLGPALIWVAHADNIDPRFIARLHRRTELLQDDEVSCNLRSGIAFEGIPWQPHRTD